MGQKVNPISLRLEKTNRHFDSSWYDDYNYTDLLLRDLKIKNYFKFVLNQIKYPEGRILIENLPKKSNINLFYCNPSNSRRKKNIFFQLQDYKEKKSQKRFFSFPEQKYFHIEKSATFTLAQQGLEGWKNSIYDSLYLYKKNVQFDGKKAPVSQGPTPSGVGPSQQGLKKQIKNKEVSYAEPSSAYSSYLLSLQTQVLHKNRLFYCLSDLIQTKKLFDKSFKEKQLLPKKNCEDQLFGKELLFQENKKKAPKEYSKIKEIMEKKSYGSFSLYQKRDPFVFFRQNKHNLSEMSPKEECGKDNTLSTYPLPVGRVQPMVLRIQTKSFEIPSFNKQEEEDIVKILDFNNRKKDRTGIPYNRLLRDKSLSTLSKAHRNRSVILLGNNNINNFLLQFVLKKRENNKRVEKVYSSMPLFQAHTATLSKPFKIVDFNRKQDTDTKWVVERFFVRYLLARLYGEFLQNKSVYSQENLRALYQFRLFFQEKNKKQSIEERDSKKPICKKLPKYGSLSEKQDIGKKVQRKNNQPKSLTKYNNFFASKTNFVKEAKKALPMRSQAPHTPRGAFSRGEGLYSSNLVYKSHLESFLSKQYNSFFNLHLFRTLMEMQGALFLVQEIIYYLERKIPFRRIKTQILKEIPRYKHIKGVRMSCSGRVGGRSKKAQRSKTQSVKIGQTPLGVFSSKIDFASKSALTRFGLIGVKVWVCYR